MMPGFLNVMLMNSSWQVQRTVHFQQNVISIENGMGKKKCLSCVAIVAEYLTNKGDERTVRYALEHGSSKLHNIIACNYKTFYEPFKSFLGITLI